MRLHYPPNKTKDYEFFTKNSCFTDDTVMTVAVVNALMAWNDNKETDDNHDLSDYAAASMQAWGRMFPKAGYGGMFAQWLRMKNPFPYNSFGNGSAMRISPVGWFAETEEEVKKLSNIITSVTHNHPEGIKGAEATAMCIFLAKNGASKEDIKNYVETNYYGRKFKEGLLPCRNEAVRIHPGEDGNQVQCDNEFQCTPIYESRKQRKGEVLLRTPQ